MYKTISAKLLLVLFLGVIAIGAGVFAYGEPFGTYPANTTEPIDISGVNQVKVGPLSVFAFNARGNADFKQDLEIKGIAQGCNGMVCDPLVTPKPQTTVNVGTNLLARGDIKATGSWQADSLVHNTPSSPTYLPVCADANGIIVFCPGPTVPPPPVDVCPDNVPGNPTGVQTANPDIEVDPITNKCTITIRATIWAGRHGSFAALNMAHQAYMTDMKIKNITVTSVGGDTTNHTWPSPTPLRFHWGFCAKRNTAYSGSGPRQSDYTGSIATGLCAGFNPNYPYLNTLPYGTWNYGSWPGQFYGTGVAWDGVSNMPAHWEQSEGYQLWIIDDPKGTFDASSYEKFNQRNKWAYGYNIYVKLPPGAHPNEIYDQNYIMSHLEYILPIERLVVSDLKVPAGYKLILTNDAVNSPNTQLDVHPVTNSVYIANTPLPNVTRVNAYIPGGFGVDLALDGRTWTDHIPNGTYNVSVQCSSGTGSSVPSSFTLPKDWGVPLTVKCQ